MGIPSLDNTAIAANTLGSGIETFRDLYRGNNGTQATADQRSAWGRVPKSTRRQELTNSIFAGGVSGTPGTLPTGLTTGNVTGTVTTTYGSESVICDVGSTSRVSFRPANITVTSGQSLTLACDVLVTSGLLIASQVILCGSGVAGTTVYRVNGVVGNGGTVIPVGVLSRVEASITFSAGGSTINQFGIGASSTVGPIVATISRPQLEFAASSTNYQRAASAFDITEPGQPSCYYLQPDGVNDGYVTGANLDLSGTDKVTVFAAVRKLSDAAIGSVVENPTIASDGTFALLAPNSATSNIGWSSKGTTTAAAIATGITSPATRIITGIGDISGDISRIRINGVQAAETLTDQGTGNYRNDVLAIFRRNAATLPFNGQCFALIVAGGSYSTATIQRVEQILSKYTPGVTL